MDLLSLKRSLWALPGARGLGSDTEGGADTGVGGTGVGEGQVGGGSNADGGYGNGTPSTSNMTAGQESTVGITNSLMGMGVPLGVAQALAGVATLGGNVTGTQMAASVLGALVGLPIGTAVAVANKFGISVDPKTGAVAPGATSSGFNPNRGDGGNNIIGTGTPTSAAMGGSAAAPAKTPAQIESERLAREGGVATPLENIFNAMVGQASSKTSADYLAAIQAMQTGYTVPSSLSAAVAGTQDDKARWYAGQIRSGKTDAQIRATVTAEHGALPDADWAFLRSIAQPYANRPTSSETGSGSAVDAYTQLKGANSGAGSALDAQLAGLQAKGFGGGAALDAIMAQGQGQNVAFDRKEYDADPTGLMGVYQDKYLPYGDKMMDQVDLYGSGAYRDQQRNIAMGDMQQQGDAQYGAAERELFRRGVGGSAGQMGALANQRAVGIANAKVQAAMQSDKNLMDVYQKGLSAVNAQGIEVAKLGQEGAKNKATWDLGQDDLWLKAQLGNQSNAANWGKIAVDRYGVDQNAAAAWGKIGVDKYSADLTNNYNWGSLGLKAKELDMTNAQKWGDMGLTAIRNDQTNATNWGQLALNTKALGMDNAYKYAALDTQRYGYDVGAANNAANTAAAADRQTSANQWSVGGSLLGIGLASIL